MTATTTPEIQFYHLLATSVQEALPKLLERAFTNNLPTLIHCEASQIEQLDHWLWNYAPNAFLPHGREDDAHSDKHPIWLTTTTANANHATLLIILDGVTLQDMTHGNELATITRVFDIFDGADDNAVTHARTRWKHYADLGYALRYIQQNPSGGWDIKKEIAAKQ